MTEDRALLAKALEALKKRVVACAENWPWKAMRFDTGLGYVVPQSHDEACGACRDMIALLSSTAAQEALREREELLADRRRLDKLEEEMLAEPVLLHNLDTLDGLGRPRGLGLCGGRRTLRKAIDDSMGEGGR